MPHRLPRRAPLVLLILVLSAAMAPSASAAPSWDCRASAYHHSVAGSPVFEPIKADPSPCASASAGAAELPGSLSVPASVATAGTLSARTSLTPIGGATPTQTATATGRVENLAIAVPGGLVTIGVRAATATATARCASGSPALSGSSEIAGLALNGNELALPALIDQANALLAPLNQLIEIRRDEQTFSGGMLVRRALHVRLLNAAGAPLLDAVAGEAAVGANEAVCSADGSGGGGVTLPPGACPRGSSYDADRNLCVIGGQGVAGIVVGRPFEGPSGGRVLSLRDARRTYGYTRCLTGPGPGFAIVGTSRGDRITGTNKGDRILALGGADRVDGGRGIDCIDGGTGSDALVGGLGNDRLYGVQGNDSLNGGPGNDRLDGGSGNDAINSAYGSDLVIGGSGADVINVATAGPKARVSCGSGRDKVRANANERSRLSRCETRFVLDDRG